MAKTLDTKLSKIAEGRYAPTDFIIADAKDGDMAFGCQTAGLDTTTGRFRSITAYRDDMKRVVSSGLVDIMLMSVSSGEILTDQNIFADSAVTPAVRYNDTTDIWHPRGNTYNPGQALPFRTARLDRVAPITDLGLYSITFYNDLIRDHDTLDQYCRFRDEASDLNLRHFLEVFNPNYDVACGDHDFGAFNNDMIVRTLAGVAKRDRPVFLKAAYNGPRATEEIAGYDPHNIIFGILGGAAGTTRDCLELIKQAEKYGARVALFGRKIYYSEDSVTMLRAMRRVLEDGISSAEATKAYHADLAAQSIAPHRDLADDLQLTEAILKPNVV